MGIGLLRDYYALGFQHRCRRGRLCEWFAGGMRLAMVWRRRLFEGIAIEAYPGNPDDSGRGSKVCHVAGHTLTDIGLLVHRAWSILPGRIHWGDLSTPCHSRNVPYQHLGPGTRNRSNCFFWNGSLEVALLGAFIVSAIVASMSCLYISQGSRLFEHPFRSATWNVAVLVD